MKPKHLTIVGILLLLVPVGFWTASVVQEYSASGGLPAILWVYHPARAFALIGFVLMFYQFLLGARLPVMEKISPRNKLLTSHRSLGKIGFILMLVHGLVMLSTDLIDYGRILFTLPKLLGITALFLLIIAVIASWFFKPLKLQYQTWTKMHLLAYLVFPLAFFHAITIGTTVRGYNAVRIQFVILMLIYAAVVVYRIAVPPAKKAAPKVPAAPAKAAPEAATSAEQSADGESQGRDEGQKPEPDEQQGRGKLDS